MNKQQTLPFITEDLQQQRNYWTKYDEVKYGFDLVVADAFIRGIRDIGYKSTATALDELIDNSIQAGAQNIHVVLDEGSKGKPGALAVIDDGHGMDPQMIRLAVMWGGGHRENDRTGFGRYGYGLPSSSVSQGRRFTVFSTVDGEAFHQVTIDIDDMSAGHYIDPATRRMVVPPAEPAYLPQWVEAYIRGQQERFSWEESIHGTVVLIDKLDRLTWKTSSALERNLLQHFGTIYRNFLDKVRIYVNGKAVQCIDPLFTSPHCRHYNAEQPAQQLPMLFIEVKDPDKQQVAGVIKVRFAYMGPSWQFAKDEEGSARFNILKEHNGFIFLRNGRQIDVVTRNPWTAFVNNDRYWGIEIDFPAALDEEFAITTSKQQVVVSDRIWEKLKQGGVERNITELRNRYKHDKKALEEKAEEAPEAKKASEQVMEEAAKFKTVPPAGDPVEREMRVRRAFEEEVRRRSEESGVSAEVVQRELEAQIQGSPYKVIREHLPGAPFYRVAQIGGQKVLYLNTAHRFYAELYRGSGSTPYLRAGLELVLWALGEAELDSANDRQRFYEAERSAWSQRLNTLLNLLADRAHVEDDLDAADQADEDTAK